MSFPAVAASFLLIIMAALSVRLFFRTDTRGSRLMLAGVVVFWAGLIAAVLVPKFRDGYGATSSESGMGAIVREMLILEPPSLPVAGVMTIGAALIFTGFLLEWREERRGRER